jgi:hypothetical protein
LQLAALLHESEVENNDVLFALGTPAAIGLGLGGALQLDPGCTRIQGQEYTDIGSDLY